DAIFLANSSTCSNSCCAPERRLDRLGNTLSSMHRPASPAPSIRFAAYATLCSLPYPVSASNTTGTRTASSIDRAASRNCVIDRMLESGTQFAAEIQKLLAHTKSNCASSINRASRASRAPTPTNSLSVCRRDRRRFVFDIRLILGLPGGRKEGDCAVLVTFPMQKLCPG